MASNAPSAAAAKTTPKKVPPADPQTTVPKLSGAEILSDKVKAFVNSAKTTSVKTVNDPNVQVSAASAAAGTVVLGACGGFVGLLAGGVVGLPFAIFTFGLSVPISAAIGGGLGIAAGGATGCATGGAAGFTGSKYRKELGSFIDHYWCTIKSKTQSAELYVENKVSSAFSCAKTAFNQYRESITDKASKLSAAVSERTSPVAQKVQIVAKDPQAQVTAASAAAGGLAVGVPCGAVGLIGGAIVGIVPAFFTFGLSIPVCAVVGGGGAFFVGGSVGAAGAGAVGYGAYARKVEIRQGASNIAAYAKKLVGRK